IVVLPLDSGPKTSTTRPRGNPPTPRAASKLMAPVEMTEMGRTSLEPRRMMEPLPNCFSICASARSIALLFSSAIGFLLNGAHYTPPNDWLILTLTHWLIENYCAADDAPAPVYLANLWKTSSPPHPIFWNH